MRRRLPVWVHVLLSALAAMLLCWPFANYYWCTFIVAPAGGKAGPPAVAIVAPVPCPLTGLADWTYRYSMAIPESILGGSLGIAALLLIQRLTGPPRRPETRCRRCGVTLAGLKHPQCPACGESL